MGAQSSKKPVVDAAIKIPTTSGDFLRAWLEATKPIHKLTASEMNFAALLLKKREEIAKDLNSKDSALIEKLLFDKDMLATICQEAGIKSGHMQIMLRKMRLRGVLNGKRFNPLYVPVWRKDKPFRLLFLFLFNES